MGVQASLLPVGGASEKQGVWLTWVCACKVVETTDVNSVCELNWMAGNRKASPYCCGILFSTCLLTSVLLLVLAILIIVLGDNLIQEAVNQVCASMKSGC